VIVNYANGAMDIPSSKPVWLCDRIDNAIAATSEFRTYGD
jgi:hypothetical protein